MNLRPILLVSLIALLGFSACKKTASLKVIKAGKASVESTVTTINSGTVTAEQQAVLAFGAVGRINKISVHLGDTVKHGQALAELENSDLQIVHKEAAKEWERAQKLFAEGLVSQVGLDESRRAAEVARVNLEKTVIKAPFDGIITEQNLQIGESARTDALGKAPIRIIDLKPRIVKGDIDEIDLARVKIGQKARVRVPAARSAPFIAEVRRVVPYVDTTKEQDRTSQIELTITEEKESIPVGASAEIEIVTGEKQDTLALPTRLILGSGESRYAYRVIKDELIKTPLKLGMGNYDRTEILSGITLGDTVAYPSDDVELAPGLKVKSEVVVWP